MRNQAATFLQLLDRVYIAAMLLEIKADEQPRVPAGSPEGGQFTSGDGGGGASVERSTTPATPDQINANERVKLGTVYRGTEKGGGERVRPSEGDLGTGVYVTQERWLAGTYGGGPTASVGAGTREVHEFTTKPIYPSDVTYVFGGSKSGEKISLWSGSGVKLWEGEWSGKNIDRALRDSDTRVVIGTPGSIGINQIAIRDISVLQRRSNG